MYHFPSVPFNSDIEIRLGLVSQRAVNKIVHDEQLDVIHTHTEFTVGWAGKRAARKMGLPLMHTAHTMYEDYRHYLFLGEFLPARVIREYLRFFLRGYDVLVCPSQKARDYFRSFMPRAKQAVHSGFCSNRIVVIGNGVCRARFNSGLFTREEIEDARRDRGIEPSDKVIIYVGRMAQEKRAVELLDALKPLLQKYLHYKALFVGRGSSLERMRSAVERAGLHRQVIFTGYVDWEEIPKLYALADVFVTASLSENHPMTLIEAAMCGLPIVARRDDSYVDLVRDGHSGYLVDADSQLAMKLKELLRDEAKLCTFSQNALLTADKFDIETHVAKMERLYNWARNRTRIFAD